MPRAKERAGVDQQTDTITPIAFDPSEWPKDIGGLVKDLIGLFSTSTTSLQITDSGPYCHLASR